MTGEKNRYTTTEKLWKLDDETLSTPKHDEMVLWLLNKNNVLKTVHPPHIKPESCRKKMYMKLYNGTYPLNETFIKDLVMIEDISDSNYISDIKNEWEYIRAEYNIIEQFYTVDNQQRKDILSLKSEVPITAGNGFLVGYVDIEIVWCHEVDKLEYISFDSFFDPKPKIYIEVKTKIKSFGETLRQLNTYKHYLNTENLYLFTTDLRFKDAFESQGIKVLTYPGQMVL